MDIEIGKRRIGDGWPCYTVAEIGINHNGDVGIATKLVSEAAEAGADAVKFQKRTVDLVYSPEELARPRESMFGNTNGDLKRGLEFSEREYEQIYEWAALYGIHCFASPWDTNSVAFMEQFHPPCYKIASACLTDDTLLRAVIATGKPILLSSGMSSLLEIDKAVALIQAHGNPLVLLQCTSTYPSKDNQLNLATIRTMRKRYGCLVGYSGHEHGLATTVAAVALGACVVERHLTLDRSMWGSDQSASIEPHALARLVRDIRAVEAAIGDGRKIVYEDELPVREKLRRASTLCLPENPDPKYE